MAILVQALTFGKQYQEAGRALKELALVEPNWSYLGLLEKPMVHKIAKECNLDFDRIWSSGQQTAVGRNSDDEQDDRDEEIQEVIR